MSFIQLQLEDSRRQLVEASQSLVHSQSEVSYMRNIQQQCTHLRYELDATRLKLDNLTEMQIHTSSEPDPKVPVSQVQHVKMVDKSNQTAIQKAPDTKGVSVQTPLETEEADENTGDKSIVRFHKLYHLTVVTITTKVLQI